MAGQRMQKKTKKWNGRIWQEKIAEVYLLLMLFLYPIFLRNKLYDVLRAKRDLYGYATAVFLVLMIALELYCMIKKEEKAAGKIQSTHIFLLLETAVLFISWMLCEQKKDSFLGLTGRYLGVATMLLGMAAMLELYRHLKWKTYLTWAYLLGTEAAWFFQILNEWKIDILETGIAEERIGKVFTGTFGNINFTAEYDAMMAAIGMALFFLCKDRFSKVIYTIFLVTGFWAVFCCRSDGAFAGLGVAYLVLCICAVRDKEKQTACVDIWGLFFVAALLMKVFYSLFEERAYALDGIPEMLLKNEVLAVIGILWLLGELLVRKHMLENKYIRMGCMCMLLLGIAGVGIQLWRKFGISHLQKWELPDEWGTGRGYIWKRSLWLYRDFPISKKLFGCGMNCFSYAIKPVYGDEMSLMRGKQFIDAHNEYLHMLVTTGIGGFVGYFGMIGSILWKSIRGYAKNPNTLMGITGITAFLALAMLNGPQIGTMPVLLMELGIFWAATREHEN